MFKLILIAIIILVVVVAVRYFMLGRRDAA